MNTINIRTIDKSYPTKIKDNLIKRVDTNKLNSIGLLSKTGDIFTISLDNNMKLHVVDQNENKITVLRNSKLSHILMRLLNRYDTKVIKLQAI